jgi:hypothetical protein
MKKLLLLTLSLLSLNSFSEELALSKDEVISRIEAGTLNFNKSFALPLNDKKDGKTININKDLLVAKLLKSNPSLKEEYLYYNYFRTNKWEYTVSYDWYVRKCKLRIGEFKREGKNLNYIVSDMMINGTEIPLKYCEKLYGMTIK